MSGVAGAFLGVKTLGMADINCEVDIFGLEKNVRGGRGVKNILKNRNVRGH